MNFTYHIQNNASAKQVNKPLGCVDSHLLVGANLSKECTRCKHIKPRSDFRLRTKRGYEYANSTCRECDAEITREYYKAKKDNPEFKKKNVRRVTEYREANYEVVMAKIKARRQTKEYKTNRKKYIKKNKAKIQEQEKACKSKYHNYHRDNLTDNYVLRKLCGKNDGHLKEVFASQPSLIEAKRMQIKLLRLSNFKAI